MYTYTNGNYLVSIYPDGTKIRDFTEDPKPIFPESLDVKITNYCDAGCAFCHEKSTREGLHGDTALGLEILRDLPSGAEIAIGGGNPLSHPDILNFLKELKNSGLIPNITVNSFHLKPYKELIQKIRDEKLIYGLGISYLSHKKDQIPEIIDENTVIHLIIGVHTTKDLDFLLRTNKNIKILLLGYKIFGRGEHYYDKLSDSVNKNIQDWNMHLANYFQKDNIVISFDNLAIKQLNVKRFFTKDGWKTFFMGDDGTFTMYMDLVKKEYSVSSTSIDRFSIKNDIKYMFKKVRSL